VARQVSKDAVIEALGHVKYPGFASDIVALGIVEDAAAKPDGGFAITIRQVTERDEVIRDLAAKIHHALTHELGVPQVELRVHRIEAELGEKTGGVRLEGTKHIIANPPSLRISRSRLRVWGLASGCSTPISTARQFR
jgi:metal-sulfur cluster biosynthetic enzyme